MLGLQTTDNTQAIFTNALRFRQRMRSIVSFPDITKKISDEKWISQG